MTSINQAKTASYAKFVDLKTLKRAARDRGHPFAKEAAAAVEIQQLCIKAQKATGEWPDRDAAIADYFARA